jgi:methylenetetrahydrofolate reductase (NADPH)
MHIQDIFQADPITFSFEFFPPKTDEAWEQLFETIAQLEPLKPSFVSVTYGAGGSTRERTHDLIVRIQRETSLTAVSHLTCVCHDLAELSAILDRYAASGVENILALRGDPPKGQESYDRSRDAFQYADQLVAFIRSRSGVNGGRGFGIGVAGFPEGHPECPNRMKDMDNLKRKVDAGADYICTQLFFDNRDFYDFRERCELAGIRVPILAGIMPITSRAGMARMAELALGARYPAALLRAVDRCRDEASVAKVGQHWATEQCRDLLDHQVRGLHFYTLNRSDATRKIYENLGVADSQELRAVGRPSG